MKKVQITFVESVPGARIVGYSDVKNLLRIETYFSNGVIHRSLLLLKMSNAWEFISDRSLNA